MTDFAQRLRAFREQRGYSLSDLARASGVSRGYLHLLEQGESNPTLDKLELIARALSLTVSVLIGEASEQVHGEAMLIAAYRDCDLETVIRLTLARIDAASE